MTRVNNSNTHILKPDHPDRLKEKLHSVPETAGVYQFLNKNGTVIYIGKSVNLKKRVKQYFNPDQNNRHTRTHVLIHNIADMSWEVTHSELLALLREDELIKKHWPEYNVKQKEFLKYIYLTFTRDIFPKLQVVIPDGHFQGQHIFGPFRDQYYLKDFLDILYELFPVRTCKNLQEKKNCIKYDIGLCAGPCRNAVTKKEYDKIIENAIQFLRGSDYNSLSPIIRKMKNYSAGLDFEKAREKKRQIEMYYYYSKRQKFIKNFRESVVLINEKGRFKNAFVFKYGKLIHHLKENCDLTLLENPTGPTMSAGTKPEHEWQLIDRANVIYSWINNKKSEKEIIYQKVPV